MDLLAAQEVVACHSAIKNLLPSFVKPAIEKQAQLPTLDPAVAAFVNWNQVWDMLDHKTLAAEHRIAIFSILLDLMKLWRIVHRKVGGVCSSGKQHEVKLHSS